MSEYPEPYKFDEWNSDFAEDYLRANDDLRRMMLLEGGYDRAHKGEVLRLFGPPPTGSPLPQKAVEYKSEEPEEPEAAPVQDDMGKKSLFWTRAAVIVAIVGIVVSAAVSFIIWWLS